jgi:hypothetical protein
MALDLKLSMTQNMIDLRPVTIPIYHISITNLTQETLAEALVGSPTADLGKLVGITYASTPQGRLSLLVLVIRDRALVVQFEGSGRMLAEQEGGRGGRGGRGARGGGSGPPSFRATESSVRGRQVLNELLGDPDRFVGAFDLARLALVLFLQQDIAIMRGVDVQDTMPNGESREPLDVVRFAVGDAAAVFASQVSDVFKLPYLVPAPGEKDRSAPQRMVSRAWVTYYILE